MNMKNKQSLAALLCLLLCCRATFAQIYSFEDRVPSSWQIDKGTLSISSEKYKGGKHALQISWNAGAILRMASPDGIGKACLSRNGGINAWIYNTAPVDLPMVFSFRNEKGEEVCQLPFRLNFKGWRCLWATFQNDMKKTSRSEISSVELHFPAQHPGGTTYIDLLEFTPKVSWQNMSDAQYSVNRTDFSLIPDFMAYRTTAPTADHVISADDRQIAVISDRLTQWYLGSGETGSEWIEMRNAGEKSFIKNGLKNANGLKIGTPLFPMGAPDMIDGEKVERFRTINEKVLLPLALDYRKNHNEKSLQKAIRIYDWFNDQGWADGSGMGTLCFEKLRSSGYFHSFFLLKDQLSEQMLEREIQTLNWLTLFGICYRTPSHAGEVADNLRALAIPKLIYALSLPDKQQRQTALTAFKNYMDSALGIAPGFFGTLKADFSGYHHRGPYNSAYYPHALYAGALMAYLLHDTPYALSDQTLHNLKQGLLAFRFFCAGLEVPAGTVGRFPKGQQVLETLLPAFAYVALSSDEPDPELAAACKRIVEDPANKAAITAYAKDVNSNLAYTSTAGEMELLSQLVALPVQPEPAVTGSRFMPYSGLLVTKDERLHFNIKGFSRYIWDFESSATENTQGRYLSYGQIEYFDLQEHRKSFHPEEEQFNWCYIPGATTKVMPGHALQDKGGASSGHRNFSDETFLSGVHTEGSHAMFSFRMHDITYDTSFRANKSVFVFEDFLLCMGSDIRSNDVRYPLATTLFQAFDNKTGEEKTDKGSILADASLMYVVRQGTVRKQFENGYSLAYIDHGFAPESGRYQYYILKQKDKKLARALLSSHAPVEIVKQDNDAHIVQSRKHGVTSAALFNASVSYPDLTVRQVNIPLSYILEQQADGSLTLSLCEPDMRRTSRSHMGLLTEEDVVQEEQAFDTHLIINGLYDVTCRQKAVHVAYDKTWRQTCIILSTQKGENYTLSLHPIQP